MAEKIHANHGRDHIPGKYGDGTGKASDPITGMLYIPSDAETDGQVLVRDSTAPYGVRWGNPSGLSLPFNLGELGYTGSGTLDDTYTHTIDFQDVRVGDGILVAAMAPSLPSIGAPYGVPGPFDVNCSDSQGNAYEVFTASTYSFEDSSPAVNEGVHLQLYFCSASTAPLVAGVDSITVDWTNNVYDRSVAAWIVRHDGGAATPLPIAWTPDNDATIYADDKVTLQSPNFTPSRDNTLELALIVASLPLGGFNFQSVTGFDGFYQAKFHYYVGAKQNYIFMFQTHGADAYVVANADIPTPYEIDLGALPAGDLVSSFNGVGQQYNVGANTWKGIVLLSIG